MFWLEYLFGFFIVIIGIIIWYFSLFVEFFCPIVNEFYFSENWYNLLFISFMLDLFLLFIWFMLSYSKNYVNLKNIFKVSYINKYFNNLFVLNIIFRFFPIISHLWNFISWYNREINKTKAFITFIFWYIFILFISELISKLLWYIFNPTYCTCWNDMSYYSWISVFIFWILLLFIYLKYKKLCFFLTKPKN